MLGGRLSLDQIEEVQKAMASGKSQKEIDAMIREAGATELDVMKEIRDLLSGGDARDKVLLEQSKRTVDIQNENITAGDALRKSLEKIQDVFRDFIQQALPGITSFVETAAKVLTELKPIMQNLADGINIIAPVVQRMVEIGPSANQLAGAAAGASVGSMILPGVGTVAGAVIGAYNATDAAPENTETVVPRSSAQVPAASAAIAGIYPSSANPLLTERGMSVTAAEVRALAAAETTAKGSGFVNADERIDTSEEIRALFAFMQGRELNIPPEFTALIARYGGEGAP
jgi:hypothetical protein